MLRAGRFAFQERMTVVMTIVVIVMVVMTTTIVMTVAMVMVTTCHVAQACIGKLHTHTSVVAVAAAMAGTFRSFFDAMFDSPERPAPGSVAQCAPQFVLAVPSPALPSSATASASASDAAHAATDSSAAAAAIAGATASEAAIVATTGATWAATTDRTGAGAAATTVAGSFSDAADASAAATGAIACAAAHGVGAAFSATGATALDAASAPVAGIVIPDYPRSTRHLDMDFVRARRNSPHNLKPEVREMSPRLCFRHSLAELVPYGAAAISPGPLCRLQPRLALEEDKCFVHANMTAHRDAGWSKMFALGLNYGDCAAAMEQLLQQKLQLHFRHKIGHRDYRRGPIKPLDVVFLCALVRFRR